MEHESHRVSPAIAGTSIDVVICRRLPVVAVSLVRLQAAYTITTMMLGAA